MTYYDDSANEVAAREGQIVMPYYLIVDTSESMRKVNDELNKAVNEMVYAVSTDPIVDDLVMIGVIAFNRKADTVVPLRRPSDIRSVTFTAHGRTNYGEAFRHFKSIFADDCDRLRRMGMRIYRPCVYFFTDGAPSDRDYLTTFRSLFEYNATTGAGNKEFPYFVPFGVQGADRAILASLAYPNFGKARGRWFLLDSVDVGTALRAMMDAVAKSVLRSGKSATTGQPQIIPPQLPPGLNAQFGEAGDWM